MSEDNVVPPPGFWNSFKGGVAAAFAIPASILLATFVVAALFTVFGRSASQAVAAVGGVFLLGVGAIQLVYVVPLVLHRRRTGRPDFARGLEIGAGIIFLLQAGCWGLVAMRF